MQEKYCLLHWVIIKQLSDFHFHFQYHIILQFSRILLQLIWMKTNFLQTLEFFFCPAAIII